MVRRIDHTDLVGSRVNDLTVLEAIVEPFQRLRYKCECRCGSRLVVRRDQLVSTVKTIRSCGCAPRSKPTKSRPKSFKQRTSPSLYNRWIGMRSRCEIETDPKFHRYGARGIQVCQRWQVFENFARDIGDPPFPGATIDRIDVNGNYEPANCRWADQKTQQNNRSNTRFVTAYGRTFKMTEWFNYTRISPKILRQRLDRDKIPPERAVHPSKLVFTKEEIQTIFSNGVRK